MKRIVCLCTLPQSFQDNLSAYLMDAYDDLRKFNIEYDIKGIFIVYRNTVLLVLEGEGKAVARAAYKTRMDTRFKTCSIIVNCKIETPYFNRWSIRLVKPDSESQQLFLNRLKKELEKDFVFESPKDRKLYEDIYIAERNQVPAGAPAASGAGAPQAQELKHSDLVQYSVSLSAWPKPTQMKLTPPAMKTCSLISNRFVPYQTLIDRKIWPTEADLEQFINLLYSLETLSLKMYQQPAGVSPAQAEPQKTAEQKTSEKQDRFSQLIKKFITSPRSKVN
ncbi:MAG: BLUF domain-containing protein [Pseudomonadota bacterium]|nr:BLUF domain-containing protein [Pseudomonadota bacterium]